MKAPKRNAAKATRRRLIAGPTADLPIHLIIESRVSYENGEIAEKAVRAFLQMAHVKRRSLGVSRATFDCLGRKWDFDQLVVESRETRAAVCAPSGREGVDPSDLLSRLPLDVSSGYWVFVTAEPLSPTARLRRTDWSVLESDVLASCGGIAATPNGISVCGAAIVSAADATDLQLQVRVLHELGHLFQIPSSSRFGLAALQGTLRGIDVRGHCDFLACIMSPIQQGGEWALQLGRDAAAPFCGRCQEDLVSNARALQELFREMAGGVALEDIYGGALTVRHREQRWERRDTQLAGLLGVVLWIGQMAFIATSTGIWREVTEWGKPWNWAARVGVALLMAFVDYRVVRWSSGDLRVRSRTWMPRVRGLLAVFASFAVVTLLPWDVLGWLMGLGYAAYVVQLCGRWIKDMNRRAFPPFW